MVEEDPGDPFPKYALAMELHKQGDDDEALTWFGRLVNDHPDYVAVYYQMASLLYDLDRIARAEEVITAGLAAARAAGDDHAARELAELRSDNA